MKPNGTSLLSRLRALPRPAWILFLGTFLNKFGTFVMPFLTLYLTHRGFSLENAALAISAYGLGTLLASALGGHLADTFGRRKTIALSMFSGAAALMLLSQSRRLPAIIAMTFLTGATGELYRPASSALLADLVPPELRVTAFSAYRMAFNAGFAFGPATAGFLSAHGYFWLFAGNAATCLLFGLVALTALPRGVRGSQQHGAWRHDMKVLARDHEFHRVLISAFLIALVFMQMGSTYSLHVTGQGFSPAVYGLLLSCNGLMVVLCELPLTSLTGRFPSRPVIAAGYVLIAAGFALNAAAHTVAALAACMVIFTFGEMTTMPVSTAYIAGLAPERMRGRYMGAHSLVWGAALVAAPQIGMRLFGASPALLWYGCGAVGLLAAAVILRPLKAVASPTSPPKGESAATIALRGKRFEP
jgi:MFS family permease